MVDAAVHADVLLRAGVLDGQVLPAREDFSVSVATPAARFVLRGDAGAISTVLGTELPLRTKVSDLAMVSPSNHDEVWGDAARVVGGEIAALWLGPDEWLLIAPDGNATGLGASLENALAGLPHSLVDVSHRQIGLILDGRLAARVLSAGCPLDLRLAAFPVGVAMRTIFLKTEVVLWRQAENRFHVEVWRSFAPYLVGHLTEALAGAQGL